MNFPDELRAEAKNVPVPQSIEMIDIAGDIEVAVSELYNDPHDDQLRKLNGLWARARRLMVTPSSNEPEKKLLEL